MPSLIAYRKHIDALYTRELRLPEGPQNQRLGTELCTIDDVTYVSLPDGAMLPTEQPTEILASIQTLPTPVPDGLRDEIKTASPHVRLINERVRNAIAERYSLADEIKLLRTAPSPEMQAYDAYAEECRAWGRAEKAKLGL
jgi:hypothetical protein